MTPDPDAGEEVISPWEWAVSAAGLALVLFAVVVMVREMHAPTTPADVVVRLDSVTTRGGRHLAHLTVQNRGTEPATGVVVEGELATPEGDTLVNEMTVDLLPAGARTGTGLFFEHDPRRGILRVRALGFQEP